MLCVVLATISLTTAGEMPGAHALNRPGYELNRPGAVQLMKGQLEATTHLLAAFIAASPDAEAFVRDVLPWFSPSIESVRQRGQNSQTLLDGWNKPEKLLSDWQELLKNRNRYPR